MSKMFSRLFLVVRNIGSEMSNVAGCMFLNKCAICFSSCFIDSMIQYVETLNVMVCDLFQFYVLVNSGSYWSPKLLRRMSLIFSTSFVMLGYRATHPKSPAKMSPLA